MLILKLITSRRIISVIIFYFPNRIADARNQITFYFLRETVRRPGYVIVILSRILYGCGLIRVYTKTYVIEPYEKEKEREKETACSRKLG